MWATVFFFGLVMVLSSCSSDDAPNNKKVDPYVTPSNPGPLANELAGTWVCSYEATGNAQSESGNETSAISYVIDSYQFRKDGNGSFNRYIFNGKDNIPSIVQGILGYGDFIYNTTDDGTVRIALVNHWDQSYPQQWEVHFADNAITAQGINGQALTLQHPIDGLKEALNAWAEKNGSKQYNVNDYKPTGVDNSQWMKQLQDSRLVADLSLPGSHDACTAEGWFNQYLAFAFEMTAKCQDLTISEQLKVGVRVFDLRPERDLDGKDYVLRCCHGPAATKMYVSDFFKTLKQWLADNPTEFLIVTIDLSNTKDKTAWGKEFSALVNSSDYKSLFSDFKPRLTVGEMRGKVLMLSRCEYAEKPLGGYCYGWVYDLELEKQQKGHILGADGEQTPLWVQDYWGKPTRDGKDEAVVRMLEAASQRDMNAEKPAWVINYPSAYFTMPFSDSYRENAVSANKVTIDWLGSHSGSVGIIYMDFAGMDKSPNYTATTLYETVGMKLVDSVIKQNWK